MISVFSSSHLRFYFIPKSDTIFTKKQLQLNHRKLVFLFSEDTKQLRHNFFPNALQLCSRLASRSGKGKLSRNLSKLSRLGSVFACSTSILVSNSTFGWVSWQFLGSICRDVSYFLVFFNTSLSFLDSLKEKKEKNRTESKNSSKKTSASAQLPVIKNYDMVKKAETVAFLLEMMQRGSKKSLSKI
jgi:hypothetical protein